MKKMATLSLFILCCYVQLNAQIAPPLTNKDVIEMASAGISESVVITKIRHSKCQFETDTNALKELTQAKVPENVISAMIEKSEPLLSVKIPVSADDGPRKASPLYFPYNQLSKTEQKLRLRAPIECDIAASTSRVSQLLVRTFQLQGYRVEENTMNSMHLVKDVRGLGVEILAGMTGNDNVQWSIRFSISELDGISHVSADIWITMENAFGKKTRQDEGRNAKNRAWVEDELAAVKRSAERQPN